MNEKFIEKIFCSYRFLKKKIDDVLGSKNINFIQFHILYFLKNNKKITHKEMAEFLNIKLPTLTIFLNKMINDRLIKKEVSKTDKRKIYILLTRKGKLIFNQARREIKNFVILFFKNFTNKDKEIFMKLINKLNYKF